MVEAYEKISPTAIFCARVRKKHKIPFCEKIVDLLDTKYKSFLPDLESYGNSMQENPNFISFIEGRHLSINDELKNKKNIFIIELGSGLSPRSLQFLEREDFFYVETELNPLIQLKEKIIKEIIELNQLKPKQTIAFLEINPLIREDMDKLGKFYKEFGKNKKVEIINEGVLMYFSKEEKTVFAENIHYFLEKYCPSGEWITTDFSRTSNTEKVSTGTENIRAVIKKTTKREFDYFNSEEEVKDFLLKNDFNFAIVDNQNLVKNIINQRKITENIDAILKSSKQYRIYKLSLTN